MNIEFDIARQWRAEHGQIGIGGVCIICDDVVKAWVAELPSVSHWLPGCLAIDEEGRGWRATGGNENVGAIEWVIYARQWKMVGPIPVGGRRRKL